MMPAPNIRPGSYARVDAVQALDGGSLAPSIGNNAQPVLGVNDGIADMGGYEVNTDDLTDLTDTGTDLPTTPDVPVADLSGDDNSLDAQGIEDAMVNFLDSANTGDDILKYSMNLLGVPHQFTHYCDYRTYSVSNRPKFQLIGRKFIENIFLEAPVISIIPGKPLYLPAAKGKKGNIHSLFSAANNNFSALINMIDEENLNEKLRYYDFQQDYYKYMEYVNVMCSAAAAFLDLGGYQLPTSDGMKSLVGYQWQNYRWNAGDYHSNAAMAITNIHGKGSEMVSLAEAFGKDLFDALGNVISSGLSDTQSLVELFENPGAEADEGLLEALGSILMGANFVQFYVDPNVNASDTANNQTTQSALEGMLQQVEGYAKDIAFIANAGGISTTELQNLANQGMDELNSRYLSGDNAGAISGIMSRLLSAGSNVIQGEKLIFPKIYDKSDISKNYSVTIELKTPYGNRLSYFLNVLVPLFHLIALAIPKQGTANTYSSPFLLKAFMPGMWTCNLGIVQSINIEKDPDRDSYTVDGYPSAMRVTLNIEDLYSDLNISNSRDAILFLANSSLIEYISTNCGVNLITPQLMNRAKAISSVITTNFEAFPGNVENAIFNGLDNLIASIIGV